MHFIAIFLVPIAFLDSFIARCRRKVNTETHKINANLRAIEREKRKKVKNSVAFGLKMLYDGLEVVQMVFHEAIQKARQVSGKKKSEVARDLKMPYSTYDGYEKGYRKPSPELALSIMRYYQLDPYLIDSEEEQAKKAAQPWNRSDEMLKIGNLIDRLNHSGRTRLLEILDSLVLVEEYTAPDPEGSESAPLTFYGQQLSQPRLPIERAREMLEADAKQNSFDNLIEKARLADPSIETKLLQQYFELNERMRRLEDAVESMNRRGERACPDVQRGSAMEAEQSGSALMDCGKQDTP